MTEFKVCTLCKGRMADELTIEWLQAFVMVTKQYAYGQPWFLFMDGYRTHYSLKMV